MVSRGGEQQVGELRLVQAGDGGRPQTSLGRVARSHLGESAEPGAELLRPILVRVQCGDVEVRRLAFDAASDMNHAVVERPRSVFRCEMRQHVGHRREDREPAGPAGGAVLDAEARCLGQDEVFTSGFAQSDHRFGDDQPQVLFQAFREFARAMRDCFLLDRLRIDPDHVIADFGSKRGDIVREEIKGAAAREVELGVVPVTGQDAVRHCSLTQGEAHMRTAIVYREDLFTVPEHGRRALTGGDDAHAVALQFLKRANSYGGVHGGPPVLT